MTLALTIFLHMTLVIMLREQMWWHQVQTFFCKMSQNFFANNYPSSTLAEGCVW
jgi:hypothetical protein